MSSLHAFDPVGAVLSWVAARGLVGLFGVSLFERLIPIIPSYGLLVTIGIAARQGQWSLPQSIAASIAGGAIGCVSFYALGAALGRERSLVILRRAARLFGISPAKLGGLTERLRANERGFAFLSQLIPVVRLITPGIAGLLRVRPVAFVTCAVLGLALWNLIFVGVGYLTAHLTADVNASALALETFVVLLVGESAVAAVWRFKAVRRPPVKPLENPHVDQ
jgi:membrane protein DedA with SNARE-associated domain